MVKRLFDVVLSVIGLIILSPILVVACFFVWLQDFENPFYVAPRVGKDEVDFRMLKIRSMVKNADKTGVDSTSASDMRITKVGKLIRKFKLDELSQLINVVLGDMSLVGPRPNVRRETDLYTSEEKKLLAVRPGITDLASIVFSDEGDILNGKEDPDIAYNQLIRPWKGRLALFSVQNQGVLFDMKIVINTAMAIVSREKALGGVQSILKTHGASPELIEVAGRTKELVPCPPMGADTIVTSRVSV